MVKNVSRDLLFIFVFITPMLCSSSEVEPQIDPLQLIKEGVKSDDLDPLQLSEEDDKAEYFVNEMGALTGCWREEGDYVTAPQGESSCNRGNDSIEFGITCRTAGTTTVRAQIIAPDLRADSFFVKVDSGASIEWHTPVGSSWFWASKDVTTALGAQRLYLLFREDGIKIRKISVEGACEFEACRAAGIRCPGGWPQIKDVEGEGTASSAITAESRADCAAKCAALSTCGSFKFNAASLACSFNTWAQSTTEETAECEGGAVTCKKVFAERPYEPACPSDVKYEVTDEKTCKDAAAALGNKWGLASSWNNIPGGCTISAGSIRFNLDAGTSSEGFSKVCSSSGTMTSDKAHSNAVTTETTTPSLTSVCTPGVCTKGKWAFYLSGKTEAECKATCEDGRKYVPVADGIQEDVYYFGQNGRFHDLTEKMSSTSRKVKNINYPNSNHNWKDPSGKEWPVRDHFYVRWSGYIEIKAAGKYTFNTRSGDGSRLFINDKQVTDNAGWHGMQDKRGSVELTVGKHKFWAEMFEGGGDAGMEWKYSGPDTGSTEIIVPEKVLSSSLTGSSVKEFNPEWESLGMCQAYSTDGDQCVIYTSCTELSADKESVICEDNSFDWAEPSTLKTCKY